MRTKEEIIADIEIESGCKLVIDNKYGYPAYLFINYEYEQPEPSFAIHINKNNVTTIFFNIYKL